MNRVPFKTAKEIYGGVKTANEKGVTREDLFELGLVADQINVFDKVAHYVAQRFAENVQKIAEEMATTDPESRDMTPLEKEMSDGESMNTDHAGKEPLTGDQAAAIDLVMKQLAGNTIESDVVSGEGDDVLDPNDYDADEDTGVMVPEEKTAMERLDILLGLV